MSRWALAIALAMGGCAIPTAPMSVKSTSATALQMIHAGNPLMGVSTNYALPYWSGMNIPAYGGLNPMLGSMVTPWGGGMSNWMTMPPSWWNLGSSMGGWGMMPPLTGGMMPPLMGGVPPSTGMGRWGGMPWPGGGRWGQRPMPSPAPTAMPSPEPSPEPSPAPTAQPTAGAMSSRY